MSAAAEGAAGLGAGEPGAGSGADAIRLQPEDNVATVLRPVAAGESIQVRCGAALAILIAADAVPLCHKISVAPIQEGGAVVKYGHSIGRARMAVGPGRHVHVHNLRSARAGTPS